MSSSNVRPLEFILRVVDQATGPFAAISAKIEAMQRPVRELGGAFNRLGKEARLPQLAGALRGVGAELRALAGLGRGLLVGGGIFGVSAAAGLKEWISTAGDLSAASARLKTPVEDLQQMQYAADRLANVSPDQFVDGMRVLQKSLTDIGARRGMAFQVAQRLEQISGIKVFEAGGDNRLQAVLLRTADAMRQVKDQNVAMRMAAILTGNANENMVTLFQSGAGAIQEMMERARSLGVVMSSSVVGSAGPVENSFKDLRDTVRVTAFTVLADLMPSIQTIIEDTRNWVNANREWLRTDLGPQLIELVRGIGAAARGVGYLVDSVGGLRNAAAIAAVVIGANLIVSLGNLAVALGTNTLVVGMTNSIGWLSSALLKLGTVVLPVVGTALRAVALAFAANPIGAAIVAVNVLIAVGTLLYVRWKPFRDVVDGILGSLRAGGSSVARFIALASPIGALGTLLYNQWQPFRELLDGLIEAVRYAGDWWFGGGRSPAAAAGGEGASLGPTPADIARGGAARVGGRVDVMVSAERGSSAQVTRVQSRNRSVPLATGAIMGSY